MGGAPGGAVLRVEDGGANRILLSGPKSAFAPTAASAAAARTETPATRAKPRRRSGREGSRESAGGVRHDAREDVRRSAKAHSVTSGVAPKARSGFRGRRPDTESRCMHVVRSRGLVGRQTTSATSTRPVTALLER